MRRDHRTLVDQASRHDDDAIRSLLEHHLPQLRAFVRLRSGREIRDCESCSDLVQSVCREVLEDLDDIEYRGEPQFRGWLFTTALRKIQDRGRFYRAQRRDVPRELAGDAADNGYARFYASLGTPSQAAIQNEEVERIEAAFDELPEHYREVLTLTRVAGLTHREVAERLGRSEGSVHGLVDRALDRLSLILGRTGDSVEP